MAAAFSAGSWRGNGAAAGERREGDATTPRCAVRTALEAYLENRVWDSAKMVSTAT